MIKTTSNFRPNLQQKSLTRTCTPTRSTRHAWTKKSKRWNGLQEIANSFIKKNIEKNWRGWKNSIQPTEDLLNSSSWLVIFFHRQYQTKFRLETILIQISRGEKTWKCNCSHKKMQKPRKTCLHYQSTEK